MKNLFILLCTLVSFSSLSQERFTLETYKKFNADFNVNPAEAIEKYATSEYLFTTGVGRKYTKNELVPTLRQAYKSMEIVTQDEKIQQIGNTAIVSGSFVQKDVFKQVPNTINVHKGVFNYIYFHDGKGWKLASSHHSDIFPEKTLDEAAIKQVIEAETQAYLDGDGKKLQSYWSGRKSDEHDSQFLVAIIGQPFAKAESMEKLAGIVVPNLKKQDFTVERSDFEVRINKNMAWATYTQKAIANGKTIQTDRETRILERINDVWKLVYVGEQGVK
jgi:hypothetical protein